MVGIINKQDNYISPKKERHHVHEILGTDLYNEAKNIVQVKIDNSDYLPKKHKAIAAKENNDVKLSHEEHKITGQ